jgi:hypothetical protein
VRSSVRRSFPAALVLALGIFSNAQAATTTANLFVVPSGGSGSCTRSATPVDFSSAAAGAKCSSIQSAVSAASGGDTVIVKSGTYSNANVSNVTKSPAVRVVVEPGGTANVGGTTWVGANGVVLDGTEGLNGQGFSTSSGFTVGSNGGAAVKNFTIDGALIHDAGGGATVYMTGCDNVKIAHLEIKNISNADGIQMANFNGQPWCTNVTFDHIDMHDFTATCGVDHQDGVQIRSGAAIVFKNSRITRLNNCGSQGFFANQEGDLGGNDTTLANTVISGINGNAINFSSKPPQKMINNTIDGGLNTCQPVTSTCNGVIMKNNILNSACAGQKLFHDRVQNSGDWANNVSTSNCGYGSQGDTVTSNFSAMFVNPSAYDFHLKAGAFAIGKANTSDFTATDMDGDTRDSAPDAGADEWTNGTPPPADTTPPDTTISSGPSGSTTATSGSFAFTGSDDTTAAGSLTFECALDGSAYTACSSPMSFSGIAVGSHTFNVRAKDAAGNVDASPASRTWTVTAPPADTTAPDTSISSGPSGSTTSTFASFAFTGSDDTTAAGSLTFECALDGGYTSCTSPKGYSGLSVGSHTFSVRAKDAAGNVDASPATQTWTITAPPADTTAPDTTISSGPSGSTTSTTASFGFTGSDDTTAAGSLTFECALDGGYTSCTSPKGYSGLSVGTHTFSVRATDAAGNVDASPATQTWTITSPPPTDTTAPNTTITSGPPSGTTQTTATIVFSGSDDTTPAGSLTFQCSLDSATYASCTSPKSYTGLIPGSHNVRVRAKDAAGNTDPSAASYTWTIAAPDTTAPDTTITQQPADPALSGDATFAFTGTDNTTPAGSLTFSCRLDGGAWQACTSPTNYAGLALLGHSFDVRATDAAGNTDQTPASDSWTVLAPSVPTVDPLPVTTPDTGTTTPTTSTPTTTTPATDVPPVDDRSTTGDPPLTVAFTAPAAGSTYTSKITAGATATATAPATVKRVEFWVDGNRVGKDLSAPYTLSYSPPKWQLLGVHTLSARAYDSAGNVASVAETIIKGTAATAAKTARAATPVLTATARAWMAADGGTDVAGGAGAGPVLASLVPCSAPSRTFLHRIQFTLRPSLQKNAGAGGHSDTGRLCVVKLSRATN